MDWLSATAGLIGAIVGVIGGVAGDRLRQRLSTSDIRQSIAAEIEPILVDLNFFILRAMQPEAPSSDELVAQYFREPYKLASYEFYWQEQRDRILRLPEWPRLQKWAASLNRVADEPQDALFRAIMLFESLRVPPLSNCLSSRSRKFIESVLERPDVASYKLNGLNQRAGLL